MIPPVVSYSKDDLRRDMKKLGISNMMLAQLVNRDIRVIEKWRRGAADAPPAVARLLRLMVASSYSFEDTMQLVTYNEPEGT
jgi:DNA-binding transcriptional regulator YiaG